ncbi:MAG: desulfoferrodoxin [Defluviitaleaceae bacterium]|nr:desulfoferrodoxin [Defluviitaleaceae bacterium]
MAKFFICDICGNIVGMVKDKGGPLACCGKGMTLLVPNTVEASQEKHLPDVKKTEHGLSVSVGSVLHPMVEEHYIDFIYVKTEKGGQRVNLAVGESPEAEFCCTGDKSLEVYAYCNLHGLWKTEVR